MRDSFLPLLVPTIKNSDKKLVLEALDDNWVSTAGPKIDEFEELLASRTKSKHACLVNSGTSALHLCLLAKNINNNHQVIIPSLSFAATANAVSYTGAEIIFCDVNNKDLGLDIDVLEKFIIKNYDHTEKGLIDKKNKKILKCIMPVHLLGVPSSIKKLNFLANKYNLEIVYDAAEALGSGFSDAELGELSDISAYSFNGNKIITTGSGGAVTTNNKKIYKYIKHLSTTAKVDPLMYQHDRVGYNYRMSNIQAALGISQLNNLNDLIMLKQEVFNIYKKNFENIGECNFFIPPKNVKWNNWLMMFSFINLPKNLSLRDIINFFGERNIAVRPLWSPMHKFPHFQNCKKSNLDKTMEIWSSSLCIPSSPNVEKNDIDDVINVLKDLLAKK